MLSKFARIVGILVGVLTVASITLAVVATASSSGGKGGGPTTSTIAISKQVALIVGKGLFAEVTVTYSCFPGPTGDGKGYPGSNFGSVTIGDLNGNLGSSFFDPICNDTKQRVTVPVFGNFSPGDGAANALVCGFDCAFTSTEVHLKV